MRVTFFSNFFNAHQLPLALEFTKMEDVEYTFVSLLETDGVVGRSCLDDSYSFVLKEYSGASEKSRAMRHALEDELVVFGDMAGKENYVKARAKTGKLFFRHAERLLKRGDWWRFVPLKQYRTWDMFTRYKDANMYVLCASAYTARDLSMFGFPVKKCLKWGYFPEVKVLEEPGDCNLVSRDKVLCSAQRLISLKRVDLQIDALQHLVSDGYDLHLYIAGDGPERAKLEKRAELLGIAENVKFLGQLDREGVSKLMRESSIFLATSNRKEGWGATINEAMAAGCCVIASEDMGSVPFLIRNDCNGFSFAGGVDGLVAKLQIALNPVSCLPDMGKAAAKTIFADWDASSAAKHLIDVFLSSSKGEPAFPSEGPASPVEVSSR